jgi:CHAT domain-containing protein/tetratricopeptide (TPR) repeat protein
MKCDVSYLAVSITSMRRRSAGLLCILMLMGLVHTAPAAAATAEAPLSEDDDSQQCLLQRQPGNEQSFALRVATPPLDSGGSSQPLFQALIRRLASGSASSNAGTAPEPASGVDVLAGLGRPVPPSPLIELSFNSGADLLAGRYASAQTALARCVQLANEKADSLVEAACANNQGLLHAAQGRLGQARSELERALHLYETPRSPPADLKPPPGFPTNPILSQLSALPPELRALAESQLRQAQNGTSDAVRQATVQAWRSSERLTTARGIERTRLNLGNLAMMTGQLAEARTQFERSFEGRPVDEVPACRAAAAIDLARLYRKIGRNDQSRELLSRHRVASKPAESDISLFELGAMTLAASRSGESSAEAATAPASAPAPSPATVPSVARGPANPLEIPFAAASFAEPAGRLGDDSLAQLLSLARRPTAAPLAADGMRAWQRLALRAQAAERSDLGYEAHAELMRLHIAAGQTALAAFHGKQAANLAQSTRTNLVDGSPSRDARRAFLRARRQLYETLARLLLDQGRLAEAEAALALLKEDEGQQFVGAAPRATLGRLAYLPPEQTLLDEDAVARDRLKEAERKRVAATSGLVLGGGAIVMLSREQVEAARLRLGMMLADLPAQLARKPLQHPGADATMRALMSDLREFFVLPDRRLQQFMSRLVEDAPKFAEPPGAQAMARLVDTVKKLKAIQAELAPALREEAWVKEPAVSVRLRAPGAPPVDDQSAPALDYVAAEPLERIWRAVREADAMEDQHLQRLAQRSTAPAVRSLGTASASTSLTDDTRAVLAQQPMPTALLYYLPSDDRLDVLFVSSTGRRHWRLPVPRAELETQVQAFAKQLRDTAADPRPAAQGIYTRLFAPVSEAVAQSGAKVIALSLTGTLRFVPFSALHDGQRWLIERHAVAVHPGGPLIGRLKPASGHWQVAAFGASRGAGEFSPLPNVPRELRSIVRSAAGSGVLPGDAWLDQAFTSQRLRASLAAGVPVVHIASHFKFVGGDAQASSMLLGDGNTLSLSDLAGADYRFDRTELVTLSACTTGLSADDVYGQEVDGLAALLMGQGAPSVLASLWEVNDASTATLMTSLYRLRESERLSRVVALQQAQVAMIRAAGNPPQAKPESRGNRAGRGASRVRLPGEPEDEADAAFETPLNLGQGHPFHWAAFVLMGNWQ